MGSYHACTADPSYGKKSEQKNTQNNVIEGDTRREMTVDRDQKHQEIFKAAAIMLCQLKQRYKLNKRHDKMDRPAPIEVLHVSIYPMLEYMGVDTDISDGVSKMRASTFLGDIVRLHQHTKNMLRYVHTN